MKVSKASLFFAAAFALGCFAQAEGLTWVSVEMPKNKALTTASECLSALPQAPLSEMKYFGEYTDSKGMTCQVNSFVRTVNSGGRYQVEVFRDGQKNTNAGYPNVVGLRGQINAPPKGSAKELTPVASGFFSNSPISYECKNASGHKTKRNLVIDSSSVSPSILKPGDNSDERIVMTDAYSKLEFEKNMQREMALRLNNLQTDMALRSKVVDPQIAATLRDQRIKGLEACRDIATKNFVSSEKLKPLEDLISEITGRPNSTTVYKNNGSPRVVPTNTKGKK